MRNVQDAIDAAISIFLKGHYPFVPHLTHFVDQRAQEKGITLSWDDYITWDLPWLEVCDAMLYLGSSTGADLELEIAENKGKKIFYSVDDIPALNPIRSEMSRT